MLFISYNCGKLDGGFLTPGSYSKIDMGIFKKIDYYDKISTTNIIKKIIDRDNSI